MSVPIIVICGATATGKTELAATVAARLYSEVINADSMQVYDGLDVGTGKPTARQLAQAPHHGVGHVSLATHYSAAAFKQDMDPVLDRLIAADTPPVVCGGSGLYLRAVIEGLFHGPGGDPDLRAELQARAALLGVPALHAQLAAVDPESAERIADNDERRVVRALEVYRLTGHPISEQQRGSSAATARPHAQWYGLRVEREDGRARIAARVQEMFSAGLVDEVRTLCATGHEADLRRLRPLGYVEVLDALADGGADALAHAEELTIVHTQQFAKRQGTWFRNQHTIEWLEVNPGDQAVMWADRIVYDATPNPNPR